MAEKAFVKYRRLLLFWIIPGLFIFISALSISCSTSKRAQLEIEGNKIARKIEAYRETNKRLPDSLSDIGIDETLEGPIFYNKTDEGHYILWFGKELGESVTYDPVTKVWK
jgi:hypothetical protein